MLANLVSFPDHSRPRRVRGDKPPGADLREFALFAVVCQPQFPRTTRRRAVCTTTNLPGDALRDSRYSRIPSTHLDVSRYATEQQRLVVERDQPAPNRLSRTLGDRDFEARPFRYAFVHAGKQRDPAGQHQASIVNVARHFRRHPLKHRAHCLDDLFDDCIDSVVNLVRETSMIAGPASLKSDP